MTLSPISINSTRKVTAPQQFISVETEIQTTLDTVVEDRPDVNAKPTKAKAKSSKVFIPLEDETRPTVETDACANYLHLAAQTMRLHASRETGPIRPIRIPGSAKLHWSTEDIRRVLGASSHQKGFSEVAYLVCIVGFALLIKAILMASTDNAFSVDLVASAALGAGVMGSTFESLPKPKRFTGTENPHQLAVISTLMRRPISHQELVSLAGGADAYAVVSELRSKGLTISCDHIEFIDRDGNPFSTAVFSLPDKCKCAVNAWLAKRKNCGVA
jgi:hypothetical protein